MANINLTNAEVLDVRQEARYIDGGIYQFGRTVGLSITAFIYPGNDIESTRFRKIDTTERSHIEELLGKNNTGFVDTISINGIIINNVKILSYEFPTSEGNLENHINLLRVNMDLEFYESFDQISSLKGADQEVYKATDFLLEKYARYFESFSENFSFSISADNSHTFNQSLNFSLRQDSPTNVNFASIAQEIAIKAFNVSGSAAAKVGYIDSKWADFIRTVNGNGIFSESYDTINNTFTLGRTVNSRNGAYKDSQNTEKWSASFTYDIQSDETGSISITENASIQGRTKVNLNSALTSKNEDKYENAYQGLVTLKAGAYDRCQAILRDYIKSVGSTPPVWLPGSLEWNAHSDLKTRYLTFGRTVNRIAGEVGYNIAFTTNPRMHNDAIFEYTLDASREANNITSVTESGTITPYDENKNYLFNPKTLYDKLTVPRDVISRITPLFNSVKVPSSVDPLVHPKNLTSSSVGFPAYGVGISYSFVYSDDPTLRNETYIRKLEKSSNYSMPTILRSNVIAPNIKETNYDANQSSEGTKSVSINCVLKRNPSSNKINTAHTNYLKTASDSIYDTLKSEVQKEAYVKSPQVGKGDLNWYLEGLSYNFSSNYDFSYEASMNFIDKKGVAPSSLKY